MSRYDSLRVHYAKNRGRFIVQFDDRSYEVNAANVQEAVKIAAQADAR